jgi:hypothetical protein
MFNKTRKPGKSSRHFHVEMMCNIPVLYVYADGGDPDEIKLAMDYLINYINTNPVTDITVYKNSTSLAEIAYGYFMQEDIPTDLDEIDTAAYKHIKSILENKKNIPKPTALTKERSVYMYMEHIIPHSRRLISTAIHDMNRITEQIAIDYDIISKLGMQTLKKLGTYKDLADFCYQNKVYPTVL